MAESFDVYVELDALLDTRLGSLVLQVPERAKQLLDNPAYYLRLSDDFEALVGLDKATTDKAYAARTVEVLAASLITGMVFKLNEIVRSLFKESLTNPSMNRIKVEINCWPYQLTSDEQQAIALAVQTHLGIDLTVLLIHLPPQQITPQRIRAQYSGMIFYHFNQWLVHHTKALERVMFPRVTLLAPRLYVDRPPVDPAEILIEGHPELTPWMIARQGFLPYFNLVFIPIINYCIIPPRLLRDIPAKEPEGSLAEDIQSSLAESRARSESD